MKKKSYWCFYAVKIIKQIVIEGEPDPILLEKYQDDDDGLYDAGEQAFEESIMLVRAQSFEHAHKIAEKKSREFEEPYQNPYGQQVTWKFIEVIESYSLFGEELVSGTELYSCFLITDKNETAEDFIKRRFDFNENGQIRAMRSQK